MVRTAGDAFVEGQGGGAAHRIVVERHPHAVDEGRPSGDAREVVGHAEGCGAFAREVGARLEVRPDAGRYGVGYDIEISGSADAARDGAVLVPAAQVGELSLAVAAAQRDMLLQRFRYEGADRGGQSLVERYRGVEYAVDGREDDERRVAFEGCPAPSEISVERFVERSSGDGDLQSVVFVAERAVVPDREGRRVRPGPEVAVFGDAFDGESQAGAVPAVVLRLDEHLAPFARSGADDAAVQQRAVERRQTAIEQGQTDHLVARGELQRIVAHGVAVAGLFERKSLHAVFEIAGPVDRAAQPVDAEGVRHVVLAVAGLDQKVAVASDGQRFLLVEPVGVRVDLPDVVALRAAVDRNAAHGVDLQVVDTLDVGRNAVLRSDDSGCDGVERPSGPVVANLEMEVRSERGAAVARSGDLLAAADREPGRVAVEVEPVRLPAVALREQVGLDGGRELRQVAVDRGRAVGMGDVERPSVSRGREENPAHVAVGRGDDRFAGGAVGLDVHSRMEMVGPHLSEVGRIVARHVAERVGVAGRVGLLRSGGEGEQQQDQSKKGSHASSS